MFWSAAGERPHAARPRASAVLDDDAIRVWHRRGAIPASETGSRRPPHPATEHQGLTVQFSMAQLFGPGKVRVEVGDIVDDVAVHHPVATGVMKNGGKGLRLQRVGQFGGS